MNPAVEVAARRNWRLHAYLAVTASSLTANAMVAVVVPWLVLTRTGSAAQAGLAGAVALAAALPALLLGGPLIDRWGKRRVSVGADALSAVAVAALPLMDTVVGLTLVSTLALVAIGAVFDAPGAAAREAARPAIAVASGRSLGTVNGRGEAVDGLAQIAGPAMAGIGLGLFGALTSLWVAAALLASAAVAGAYALPRDVRSEPAGRSYTQAALAGVRLVWNDRTLRTSALLGTAAVALITPLSLILSAHLVSSGSGGILGAVLAAVGAGSVAGSLSFAWLSGRLARRTILVLGLTVAAAGFAVLAAVLLTGGGTGPLIVVAVVIGIAIGPLPPAVSAITQDRTDPRVLGNIVSVTWSFALLAGPLAMVVAGLLLDVVVPAAAVAVIAAGLLITAGYAARASGLHHLENGTTDQPS